MAEHNEQSNAMVRHNLNQHIERIILANPIADLSEKQMAEAVESGRVLITAIPGVEEMSFGRTTGIEAPYRWYVRIRFRDEQALQTYETHPNHTEFGVQQWLPIIANQIVIDYRLQYSDESQS
jgi:hypothetical protein